MRFKQFKVGDRIINNHIEVDNILLKNNLGWLCDAEIENADIEVKNKTIIWNNGIFYAGHWVYGIWKDGFFHGVWDNGIWEGGNFNGTWKSGIKK